MKLPWDDKYLKISFHAVVTFAAVYIIKQFIDFLMLAAANAYAARAGFGNYGKVLSAFSPLMIAFIVAYLLEPSVAFFQKKYSVRRATGTALTYVLILIGASTLVFIVYRTLGGDQFFIQNLIIRIHATVNRFTDTYVNIQVGLKEWELSESLGRYVEYFLTAFTELVRTVADGIVNSIYSLGGGILTFLLAMVIAFYMLVEKERLLHFISSMSAVCFPKRVHRALKNFLNDVHFVFSGYIRGQLTDACIMAALISTWLTIVKVDFAVIIGVFSGFSNIIPYFGAFIGFSLSISAALLSGEPAKALYAAVGIITLQQIDGIFISPRIVGKHVELRPVYVLIVLSLGGKLFGLMGLILAVPVCAVVKTTVLSNFKALENELNER